MTLFFHGELVLSKGVWGQILKTGCFDINSGGF